ncbi:hypothetical protein TWF694_004015 [Orbilia ellipsospora]|uniref:Uncharacterized protein n=1 Tax=Orbilia ellipsospora TaxID=2528407 RepID=A0AAV9WYY3_9PEZI
MRRRMSEPSMGTYDPGVGGTRKSTTPWALVYEGEDMLGSNLGCDSFSQPGAVGAGSIGDAASQYFEMADEQGVVSLPQHHFSLFTVISIEQGLTKSC